MLNIKVVYEMSLLYQTYTVALMGSIFPVSYTYT